MRVYFVDAPPELLEERRRLGLDKRDEVWEGVVHVVPQPEFDHQIFVGRFEGVIRARAEALGFVLAHEVAVYRPGEQDFDYRVPDLLIVRREIKQRRGAEGPPEFVMEVLSPHDESRQKFPFYAALGCREVLLVDRARRTIELHRLIEGELTLAAGGVRVDALGLDLVVSGDRLRLTWDDGEFTDIPFDD